MRCSKKLSYSITSSVRASSEVGGSRPSALAVLIQARVVALGLR
jgi:hypothetical protein